MLSAPKSPRLSPLRETLDSFENAYAIATRWRHAGVRPVYVVRTVNQLQPIRVTTIRPLLDDRVIMVVI